MRRLMGAGQGCAVLLVLAALAGCATAPPRNYYTLDMTPANGQSALNLVVDRIRTSEALSKREIMIKKSPTEVEYYATDLWAASLDELVTQKLQAEFGTLEPSRPVLRLVGTVLAFEQIEEKGHAETIARILLQFRAEKDSLHAPPRLERVYEVRSPLPESNAGAAVEALSRALEQIAREVILDAQQVSMNDAV